MQPLWYAGPAVYAFIFWTIFGLWMASETVTSGTKRVPGNAEARDRGSHLLIIILFLLGIGLAFALSFVLPHAAIPWHRKSIFFIAIGLMIVGIVFRRYAISMLGQFFTVDVAIHAKHTVVDTGPYRYIRHPSYSGSLITQLGLGLALGNWASLLVILVCTGIAYTYRISVEEAALVAALGEPYREYMRRTTRLIPFVF